MITSITLSIYASKRTGPASVLSGVKPAQTQSQPAQQQPAQTPTPNQK
jgi:hypothetical protein